MSLRLEIPNEIERALRLPEAGRATQVLHELAIALYARGILGFGKARQLSGLGHHEFGALLGERGIPRHYGDSELREDLSYARGE